MIGQVSSNGNELIMRRILLVDDQAHVLQVMRSTLDRHGYEVDTALGGGRALDMLDTYDFDVVVTSLAMRRMGGRRLCEAIQQRYAGDGPLTLVVADSRNGDPTEWIANLPNTECLEKPLSLRWLVARLSEHFGHFSRIAMEGDPVLDRSRPY